MGIECEREPAFAYRAWRLRLVLMLARVLVHLLVGIRIFGFRRTPLKAKHRYEHLDLLYVSLLTPVASRNLLLYQSLPIRIPVSIGQGEEAKRGEPCGHSVKRNC